jgi:hypothetical protein
MYDPDGHPIIELAKNYTSFLVGQWESTPLFLVRCAIGNSVWKYCSLDSMYLMNETVFRCTGDAVSIIGTSSENIWFDYQ